VVINTTDVRSNADAQIMHAVNVIYRSEDRREVFKEIYRGKSSGKTAEEIASKIGIESIRVLQEALILYKAKIIGKRKIKGRLTYLKDDFFSLHKERILYLVTHELARQKFQIRMQPGSSKYEKSPQTLKTKGITHPTVNRLNSPKKTAKKIRILFLAANPKSTVSLRLDEEVREIEHKILLAQKKDQLLLIKKGAVRVGDLQLYLNQERPTIVHFSGHGTSEGRIILEDNTGNPVTIPPDALARVFETLKDNVRCIVLNACFSLEQALAINQHIDCVIGMSSTISDEAAIAFSSAFYLALSSERSIKNAFDQGINELMLSSIQEENIPQLLSRDQIDPSKIFLLK